jgi:SNF2 family DNA or RNA helicase
MDIVWKEIVQNVLDEVPFNSYHDREIPPLSPTEELQPLPETPASGKLLDILEFRIQDRRGRPLPDQICVDMIRYSLTGRFRTPSVLFALAKNAAENVYHQCANLMDMITIPFIVVDPTGERPPCLDTFPARPTEKLITVFEKLQEERNHAYELLKPINQTYFAVSAHGISPTLFLRAPNSVLIVEMHSILLFLTAGHMEDLRSRRKTPEDILLPMFRRAISSTGFARHAQRMSHTRLSVLIGNTVYPEMDVMSHLLRVALPQPRDRDLPRVRIQIKQRSGPLINMDMHIGSNHRDDHILEYTIALLMNLQKKLKMSYIALSELPPQSVGTVVRDADDPSSGVLKVPFFVQDDDEPRSQFNKIFSLFPPKNTITLERSVMSLFDERTYDARPEQPPGLLVELYPYQLDTLGFMQRAEDLSGGMTDALWVPYGEGWLHPATNTIRANLAGLPGRPKGGFVCEEVGLGKTIEMLALVKARPPEAPDAMAHHQLPGTLIVCPLTIVAQWEQTIRRVLQHPNVCVFHGIRRPTTIDGLRGYEVVLTTYETLLSEYKRHRTADGGGSALFDAEWHRVVFDESHTVKQPNTMKAKASFDVQAQRRWCVTATPFKHESAAHRDYAMWSQFKMLQIETSDETLAELLHSNHQWKHMMYSLGVRHSKERARRDMPPLPPIEHHAVSVEMNRQERERYQEVLERIRTELRRVMLVHDEANNGVLLERYAVSLLQPLRAFCGTGRLVAVPSPDTLPGVRGPPRPRNDEHVQEEGGHRVTQDMVPLDECPICYMELDNPVQTPCGHWFCNTCIVSWLQQNRVNNRRCPLCRAAVPIRSLAHPAAPEAAPVQENEAQTQVQGERGAGPAEEERAPVADEEEPLPPSKLRALMHQLQALRAADPSAKFLVFSQFSSGHRAVLAELRAQGILTRSIDGSVSLPARSRAIREFEETPDVVVMVLDLRTASFGINLTAANHVMFLDTPIAPGRQGLSTCISSSSRTRSSLISSATRPFPTIRWSVSSMSNLFLLL